MYKLSKDYKKLYELVSSGEKVVCYVDYGGWNKSDNQNMTTVRDVCECRKLSENNKAIEFLARGIGYGGVHDYDKDKSDETIEKEFIAVCEMKNVEFIEF